MDEFNCETCAYEVLEGQKQLVPEEKQKLIDMTAWAAEGEYTIEQLNLMEDRELAERCLSAMNTWCSCNT